MLIWPNRVQLKWGKKYTCSHSGNINGKGFIYETKDMERDNKVLIMGWDRRVTLQWDYKRIKWQNKIVTSYQCMPGENGGCYWIVQRTRVIGRNFKLIRYPQSLITKERKKVNKLFSVLFMMLFYPQTFVTPVWKRKVIFILVGLWLNRI